MIRRAIGYTRWRYPVIKESPIWIPFLLLIGGGVFDLYIQHDDGNTTNFLNLNGQFGIEDHEGHRWALFEEFDPVFMNGHLINDTLRISYLKDNIAFYVADGVPYFRQSYREFAVKRDWE